MSIAVGRGRIVVGAAALRAVAQETANESLCKAFGGTAPASVSAQLIHCDPRQVFREVSEVALRTVGGCAGHMGVFQGSVARVRRAHAQCPVKIVPVGGDTARQSYSRVRAPE